jgi:hypothetical protein
MLKEWIRSQIPILREIDKLKRENTHLRDIITLKVREAEKDPAMLNIRSYFLDEIDGLVKQLQQTGLPPQHEICRSTMLALCKTIYDIRYYKEDSSKRSDSPTS